jgi:hypothetical protein
MATAKRIRDFSFAFIGTCFIGWLGIEIPVKVWSPIQGFDIAKIYRKNACQEVFGMPPGFVHAFCGLSNIISLEINDMIFGWTKFCRYDF